MKFHLTHIIPVGGVIEPVHEAGGSCWCFPQIDFTSMMVVHHSKDKREQRERQPGFVPDGERSWVKVYQELDV